jgi:hypothetical protein
MLMLPMKERRLFEATVAGEAEHYGLRPDEYLRKIWYHQEAAKLGEYVASVLTEELVRAFLEPQPLP